MTTSPELSRAWVDIDLAALRRNAATVAAAVRAPLLPMIKADAYGLGAVPVARALESLNPWGYGVAALDEAQALRRAGIERPILVFTPLLPAWAGAYRAADARPCIGDLEALQAWLALGGAPFHLEIDTGMRRAGIPFDDAEMLDQLRGLLPSAEGWEGIFTHFHSADTDPASARIQWDRLQQAIATLGRRPRAVHAASSAGSFVDRMYGGEFARPGIYLYGGRAGTHQPETVARFQARVVAVRRVAEGDSVSYGASWIAARVTTIATIGAGYADGVLRSLSGRGRIEGAGTVHPIVGRVTMDMTMIDAGDSPMRPGDSVTIFGGQVSLDQQAEAAGTISYELLTSLGTRVARRYPGGRAD
ncbi:MAG TPA: alanine racemase [Gemmatimonadales bacterium]